MYQPVVSRHPASWRRVALSGAGLCHGLVSAVLPSAGFRMLHAHGEARQVRTRDLRRQVMGLPLGASHTSAIGSANSEMTYVGSQTGYSVTALVSCDNTNVAAVNLAIYLGAVKPWVRAPNQFADHKGGQIFFGQVDAQGDHVRITVCDIGSTDNFTYCMDTQDYVANRPYLVTLCVDTHNVYGWVDNRALAPVPLVAQSYGHAALLMGHDAYSPSCAIYVAYYWLGGDPVAAAQRHWQLLGDPFAGFRRRADTPLSGNEVSMGGVEGTGSVGMLAPSVRIGLTGVVSGGNPTDVFWGLNGVAGTGIAGAFGLPDGVLMSSVVANGIAGTMTPELIVNLGDN